MSSQKVLSTSSQAEACEYVPNSTASTKPSTPTVKPCCVCKEEKSRRDECMLFSTNGEADCKPTIEAYRQCMAGYGFKFP
ncbi:cysteine alpha-hairpin motif superfamily [Kalaharituber pfeilii]|nr:cysteine alpha-hairpin motif superfamily [Kalaharituber pfeilii]